MNLIRIGGVLVGCSLRVIVCIFTVSKVLLMFDFKAMLMDFRIFIGRRWLARWFFLSILMGDNSDIGR